MDSSIYSEVQYAGATPQGTAEGPRLGNSMTDNTTEMAALEAIRARLDEIAATRYAGLVRAIGHGFHPDTKGEDYTSLPEGITPEDVDAIVDAHMATGADAYADANAILAHDTAHRAYAWDYCPLCGTARVIGQ